MICDSNDKTNFPHNLLLTVRQVSRLCKIFANNSSANKKLSKTQLSKIVPWGEFLARLLRPLLKTGLYLMKNVLKPLTKSVLIPLGLTAAAAAAAAAEAGIHKNISGLAMTPLITSNKEMHKIIRKIRSFRISVLFIKGVSKTIKNEAKEQKRGCLRMLLGTISANLLGNLLKRKRVKAEIPGQWVIRASKEKIRAGQDF